MTEFLGILGHPLLSCRTVKRQVPRRVTIYILRFVQEVSCVYIKVKDSTQAFRSDLMSHNRYYPVHRKEGWASYKKR